jgi:hypothetical protein
LGAGLAQSVVTRPWAGQSKGGIPATAIDSSPPKHPNGLQCPPIDVFIGYQGAFPRANKPRHVVDDSPPSSAKVKNDRSYTSTPPVCLNGVDKDTSTICLLLKHSQYLSLVIFLV